MPNVDEKKTVGASYIFTFYVGIQNLTDSYSNYLNAMLELESKSENPDNIEPGDKNVISQYMQTVRLYCHKCYIMYKVVVPSLKLKQDPNIDEYYKKIANNFIIERDSLKQFVVVMNKILVEGIIQDLIQNNEDFIKNIYQNE